MTMKRQGLFSDGLNKRKGLGLSKFNKGKNKILDTSGGLSNFNRSRKYDTDMDRLSRRSFQNELSSSNVNITKEINKGMKELRLS